MPMPEKTLIEPDDVGSKAPLKKSTVAWALGLLMIFALVGYYVPRIAAKGKSPAQDEPAEVAAPKNTGTPEQIDAEVKRAMTTVVPSPVPDEVKPTSSEATRMPVPLPDAGAQQAEELAAKAEMDSAARVSKSIAFDQSSASPLSPAAQSGRVLEPGGTVGQPVGATGFEASEAYVRDGRARIEQAVVAAANSNKVTDQNREWLREYQGIKPAKSIKPSQVQNPLTLIQGKVIPAVLGKKLNSDLPGDVTAFTTVDVYDSLSGKHLLIPKGSQLVGEYSNQVRAGQSRLMFAFSRIVLPNGLSYDLPGNKGQDLSGTSGVSGSVNNHYFQRLFNGVLLAVLATKVEGSGQAQVLTGVNTTTSAAGEVLLEIARADLGRTKDIPPTITVPQGTRINVQVAADMEFPASFR